MTNSVLITGGSGMIGNRLSELLLNEGDRVSHVGRSENPGSVPSFVWDIDGGIIDKQAFKGIDTIIHLAGANIAGRRWTHSRKREILDSRIRSTALLFDSLKSNANSVSTLIAGSAIGYYGFGTKDQVFTEESQAGNDFLSDVVVQWEREVDRFASLGVRLVKVRTGIVLSDRGGALSEIARPVRWGLGSALGSGRQMVSWIHLDDLCRIFMKLMHDESIQGVFNATAPRAVTNLELTEAIAMTIGRPLWLPRVPSVVLRMLLGEMAEVVVHGSNVSSEKIQQKGFTFQFPELAGALRNLLIASPRISG